MSEEILYLDYHSTTPVDPRVLEAMYPYFSQEFGNAGSLHGIGEAAKQAVDKARGDVARALGADVTEIVFTSGATESNNLAIKGVAERLRRRGNHLVSVVTEHRAVLDPLKRLAQRGYQVTLLPVEQHPSSHAGWLDPARVAEGLTDETCLVSVMLANNEIGVLQPIREIADICHNRGVPLHCDATQAVGKVPVNVDQLGVDLLSFSGHKLYGPKGIGGLYVRRRGHPVRPEPQIDGGGQELGLRSGTLNVAGIVGLGRAIELAVEELSEEMPRVAALRNQLAAEIQCRDASVEMIGPALEAVDPQGRPLRLTNNLNLMLPGLDGQAVMLAAPRLAISSGATCSAAQPEPSHVLQGIGLSAEQAHSCLRFGLGRFTTAADIESAAGMVADAVESLRRML
jgi:cysteine desulfurase